MVLAQLDPTFIDRLRLDSLRPAVLAAISSSPSPVQEPVFSISRCFGRALCARNSQRAQASLCQPVRLIRRTNSQCANTERPYLPARLRSRFGASANQYDVCRSPTTSPHCHLDFRSVTAGKGRTGRKQSEAQLSTPSSSRPVVTAIPALRRFGSAARWMCARTELRLFATPVNDPRDRPGSTP